MNVQRIIKYFNRSIYFQNCCWTMNGSSAKASLIIGTHDGTFHSDEILACSMLKLLYPDSKIIRSRNPDILKTCDIVVDVGGVYDHGKLRYDHHQADFKHTMKTLCNKKWNILLSSAGLIYYHYGSRVIENLLKNSEICRLNYVYDKVYENFIQEIDGIDNGIPMFNEEPLYYINTDLSKRVSRLNKSWNTKNYFDEEEHFQKAMDMVWTEFVEYANYVSDSSYPARKIVENSIKDRYTLHESGQIIYLTEFCPWRDHLLELEKELNIEPIMFVLFGSEDSYRVQAVPVNLKSFVCRKFLHKNWRGLRDDSLTHISGIEGCIFVHANGFIGGNKTKEGALQMAVKTLEYNDI